MRSRLVLLYAVFASPLFLAGCATSNLPAIKAFSAETQALTATIQSSIEDERHSCMRRLYRDRTIQTAQADIISNGQKHCEALKEVAHIPESMNTVIAEYAKTLAMLADNQFANYSGELGLLKTSFSAGPSASHPFLKAEDIKATLSLSELILNASTESYRQREIKLMLNQHENLTAIAHTLKTYLTRSYLSALQSEFDSLESQLLTLQQDHMKKEPLRARELIEELKLEKSRIEKKSRAVSATAEALDAMIDSHARLKKEADHLDHKELLQAVSNYAGKMAALRKQLNKF